MARHVVLGKGPVGTALADRLLQEGHDVRVVSRSGGRSSGGLQHLAVDATDVGALAAAATGADVLYNCANPAYHRWPQDWPPVAAALLRVAEGTGAVLVTMGNLYGYGPVDGPLTEDLPLAALGAKGRVRATMWEQALARHQDGAVRVTEARASDFVGPGVTSSGYLAERVVPALLRGASVQCLGDPDQPHSWTAISDVAQALVVLGKDEQAWGRAWHVPTAPAVTFRDAVHGLCAAAGVAPVRIARVPRLVLKAVGLLRPEVRELAETRYQFVRPFVLDSSAFTSTFGLNATPLSATWEQTVDWWRAQAPHRRGTAGGRRPLTGTSGEAASAFLVVPRA
ncbi:MAG: NAD-dependent epimerase/dehydratase family protein [Mycobacteriales bacterium]